MDKQIERILDKLEKIDDKIADIDRTLVKNTESLQEHMRRTNLLEQHLNKQDQKLEPVFKHVDRVGFIVSILKWIGFSGVLGIIGYSIKFYMMGK